MSRNQRRTSEDRERARLEREARRAAREGRPPPSSLPPDEIPPPPIGARPDPEPDRFPARREFQPRREEPEAAPAPPEPKPYRPEPQPYRPEPYRPEPEHPGQPEREPSREAPTHRSERGAGPEPDPEWEQTEHETLRAHASDQGRWESEVGQAWDEPEDDPAWEAPEDDPATMPGPAWDGPTGRSEPAEPNGSPVGEPWQSTAPAFRKPPEPPPPPPQRPAMPQPFQPTTRRAPAASSPGSTVHHASGRRKSTHRLPRERGPEAGASTRTAKRWLIPLVLLAAIGAFAVWFLVSLLQPFGGEGEGRVQVAIPQGAGVGEIAEVLKEKEVISSPFFFKVRARLAGRSGDLKPGRFRLRKDMSYTAALDALTEGPPPDIVRVTVPEGRSRREVEGIVGDRLKGDYLALTTRSSELDPRRYGARRAANLEGFLFPATYDLKRGRPLADLVALQLRAFKREIAKVDMRAARRRKLTPYDVLTIASMVDREAQLPRERAIVASVIYNRLREGIPLGIDATIRFATGNWTRPLRQSQLAIDSPYNTRSRKGLPPGPIGSPGLAAIRAAARPANTGFLFYVVKPGTCGEHAFSRTDAEFRRDVSRYNTERGRRGGKSPTNC